MSNFTNALYSIFRNKCPKCHKGYVFISDNPYNLKKFDKMDKACRCCHEKWEKQPAELYGAMYVSYGLTVGWFVVTWALESFLVQVGTWPYLTFLSVSIVLLMPITFRMSRLIWLNVFIRYNRDACSMTPDLNK